MNPVNENRLGYKHTPLGWIPIEWEVRELQSVGEFKGGGTPDTQNPNYWNGEIPWVSPKDMKCDEIIMTEDYITKEAIIASATNLIPENSLLIVTRSGILRNRVPIAINKIPVSINQDLKAFTSNKFVSINFIFQLLEHKNQSLLFQTSKVGTTVESLDFTSLKCYQIVLPPRHEQETIETVLNFWGDAITKTQQLIVQLKQRNKGLLQQMLKAQKRLTGFEGKWRKYHIFELAKEVSLKNTASKELTVLSCTKYDGLVPSLEYFGRRVFGSDTSTYKMVPINHFAYATNHIEEGSIGYQNYFEEALISPMYTVFKTNEQVHDNYLFRLLKSHNYIHEYNKRMEGSIDRRGGLRWDEFAKITVLLPELEEQIALASFLDIADQEIKLYQQQLTSLQQQKKGLMQKLLTGEIRVKL